ncbi:S8 family serine peptidase [Bradyrhizobium liaoningense]|uniref:S8 family serine peptidase n=1 Tax=Bradyrhizobium liaoningense TaxID=43992 RepID=UPI001BABA055|nr:S8 family serine peptidase [Bradyrhizobium liaoningense]MBR1032810.1 S8 family serine peptidase [Bradyrhizobium liaoningense]
MRHRRLMICLVSLTAVAPVAAQDAGFSKTIQLRTGPVTLEPVQAPKPAQAAPAQKDLLGLKKAKGAAKVGSPAQIPAITGEPGGAAALPAPAPKPIESDRVLLGFERRLSDAESRQLAAKGIVIGEFVGGTVYTARVQQTLTSQLATASAGINSIQHVVALDEKNAHIKVDPSLLGSPAPQEEGAAPPAASPIKVSVQVWPDVNFEAAKPQIAAFGEITRVSPFTQKFELTVKSANAIQELAKLKSVKFIEPVFTPMLQNTHVDRNIGADLAAKAPHFLTGAGVRVGVWDGGHVAENHPSFTGRLSVDLDRERGVLRHDHQHSTHVAGTIAGSGEFTAPMIAGDGASKKEGALPAFGDEIKRTILADAVASAPAGPAATGDTEDLYPGIAPKAEILSFDFIEADHELLGLLIEKPLTIDLVNNSWGLDLTSQNCRQLATYSPLGTAEFDAIASGERGNQTVRRIPIIFSAGNARNDGICGMSLALGFPNYRSVTPPGTGKNVITVGAIDADDNEMTDFSSWGPTADGRIKPDIVAPGCRQLGGGERGIVSAVPASGIGRMCGTSMAAPAVAGTVALMIEKMGKLGFQKLDIHPSTYKALLIHGAEDLGRPGPDFVYGFGRVRLMPTLALMDQKAFFQASIARENEVQTRAVAVPPNRKRLKVTLVWDDKAAGAFAPEALTNDLDLVLVSPSAEQHLPFILNTVPGRETEIAGRGVDHRNVVEQVIVDNPAVGNWSAAVRATKIGSPTGGQSYSLVVSTED